MDGTTPLQSLAGALSKAQGDMKNALLNKVNPHFKSKYADLAAIRDATIPALSKHGLSIVQYTKMKEATLVLLTRLQHTSGEFIESEYPLPIDLAKPQAMGSAQTYARRYSWAAMCGIAAEEDDDANAAQENSKPAPRTAKPEIKEGDLWKSKAEAIKTLIDEAEHPEDVEAAIANHSVSLTEIKEKSATAYDFLMERASKRKTTLQKAA